MQSADPPTAADFALRYGVDTSDWPVSAAPSSDSKTDDLTSGLNANLSPGETLLDFVIVGELGRGAFSRVYLARQSSLAGRLVVLKLSSIRLREAERLAKLQHTNVVPVYSVHDHGRYSVLCMPWFGSATLKDVIASVHGSPDTKSGEAFLSTVAACDSRTLTSFRITSSRSPQATDRNTTDSEPATSRSPLASLNLEQATIWIGRQLAEGLVHAHARGILHRDLKPANVLLTEEGQPMILDFTLAAEQFEDAFSTEIAGGTLPYMSPEQIASIDSMRSLDARADVFSLGVILFEMLTGRLPFSLSGGDRQKGIEERWASNSGPRRWNPQISVDADSIIRKCLEPDPAKRYCSAAELAEDLSHHMANEPLVHVRNRSLRERAIKWARRHPRLSSTAGISSVSAVALTVFGVLLWQGQQNLYVWQARQRFQELQNELPNLHAEAFAAFAGDASKPDAVDNLAAAMQPFRVPHSDFAGGIRDLDRLEQNDQAKLRADLAELEFMTSRLQPAAGAESNTQKANDADTPVPADDLSQATSKFFSGRYAEALSILQPLSLRHPERFPVILLQAMSIGHSQGHTTESETLLTSAIALQPNCVQAWYQRGVCRLSMKKDLGASEDFSRVLELDPGNLSAHVSRAIALRNLSQCDSALKDLNTAIDGGFPETRVYFLRASVHQRMKNGELEKSDKATGLRLTPTDELSWVARGVEQLPQDPAAALLDFRKALEIDPSSHEAFRNLSMVLSEYLKRPDESIQVLTDALKHHPEDAYLWAGRGVLFARAGRRDEALKDAEEAQKRSQEPFLLYMTSCIYAITSDKAAADAEQALLLLAKSMRADASLASLAEVDPDLGKIMPRPEFRAILEASKTLSEPINR